MVRILRGDIVWAELDPTKGYAQSGRRPVLVLSHDIFNDKSGTVIAVALTSQTQKAGFPLTMPLNQKIAKKYAWVKVSHVRTISVLRLGKKIAHLNEQEIQHVIDGLNEIIG